MIRETDFLDALDDIYAAFGKKMPEQRIATAAYRRIENLPAEFLPYAKARLEDMEKLPSNLGLFMLKELWPDYRAEHPEKFVNEPLDGCEKCSGGLRIIYDKFGIQYATACQCCTNRDLIEKCGQLDDYEITSRGLFTAMPVKAAPQYERRKIVQDAIAAANEPPRQRHIDFMRELDGDDPYGEIL